MHGESEGAEVGVTHGHLRWGGLPTFPLCLFLANAARFKKKKKKLRIMKKRIFIFRDKKLDQVDATFE